MFFHGNKVRKSVSLRVGKENLGMAFGLPDFLIDSPTKKAADTLHPLYLVQLPECLFFLWHLFYYSER